MKKIVLVCLFITHYSYNQINKDTLATKKSLIEKDTVVNVSSSWYGRSMFLSLTTGSDTKGETLSQRISRNIELGKSIGSVDIGLALGEFKHSVIDSSSTQYAEMRFTLDDCQLGIFSNEITVGAGYMFNSKTPVMLEISSTLFAQLNKNWGLGFVFGNTDFVGDYNDMNKSFFGLYFRYGLQRNDGGILINKFRLAQRKRTRSARKRAKPL